MISVFGLHRANPVLNVEFLPDASAGGIGARIARPSSIDIVRFGDIDTDAHMLFQREDLQLRA